MDKKPLGLWLLLTTMLLIALGCGGGGGSTSNPPPTGVPAPGQYLEFFLGNNQIDPMQAVVGQTLLVRVVNYDGVGNRTELPGSNWVLSGPGAGSVSLSQAGVLTINSQPSGIFTISASTTVGGQARTVVADVFVPSSLATTRVSGRILSTNGTTGLVYLQVRFYDAGGNLVGGATTTDGGYFTGTTLNTAVWLTVKPETIPSAYYRTLRYQGENYATTGTTCLVPLPTLSSGANNQLPASIFVPRLTDGPPPPPSGCN